MLRRPDTIRGPQVTTSAVAGLGMGKTAREKVGRKCLLFCRCDFYTDFSSPTSRSTFFHQPSTTPYACDEGSTNVAVTHVRVVDGHSGLCTALAARSDGALAVHARPHAEDGGDRMVLIYDFDADGHQRKRKYQCALSTSKKVSRVFSSQALFTKEGLLYGEGHRNTFVKHMYEVGLGVLQVDHIGHPLLQDCTALACSRDGRTLAAVGRVRLPTLSKCRNAIFLFEQDTSKKWCLERLAVLKRPSLTSVVFVERGGVPVALVGLTPYGSLTMRDLHEGWYKASDLDSGHALEPLRSMKTLIRNVHDCRFGSSVKRSRILQDTMCNEWILVICDFF